MNEKGGTVDLENIEEGEGVGRGWATFQHLSHYLLIP